MERDSFLNELRVGAITAIDGLWFLAAEKKLGFEAAMELDLEVWSGYGVVMLKRTARAMGIDLSGERCRISVVCRLLELLCLVDGTECSTEIIDDDTARVTVCRCSWWENLERAGRTDLIDCEMVDNHTFRHWLAAIDSSLEMRIESSLPRGDDFCCWTIERKA